jgi:hypothetical protein
MMILADLIAVSDREGRLENLEIRGHGTDGVHHSSDQTSLG